MIPDRLGELCLLPPPSDAPWAGAVEQSIRTSVTKADGSKLNFKVPLFWYLPRWHDFTVDIANQVALRVSQWSLPLAALRSELSEPGHPSVIHAAIDPPRGESASEESTREESVERVEIPDRILPYRPERYGLSPLDFDDAAIIDVRLAIARDATGRFAYPPEQLQRWEATPDDQPLAGGGWVPAATFPPDVLSFEHLEIKLDQLRSLSPKAAIFISINPYRLSEELPRALSSQPDGVILVMTGILLGGLELAGLTYRTRQMMNSLGATATPLWIVPGDVSAEDAVKLVALGASAIAIDGWAESFYTQLGKAEAGSAVGRSELTPMEVIDVVDDTLGKYVDRFVGLYLSLQRVDPEMRLGSFDAGWVDSLSVQPLG